MNFEKDKLYLVEFLGNISLYVCRVQPFILDASIHKKHLEHIFTFTSNGNNVYYNIQEGEFKYTRVIGGDFGNITDFNNEMLNTIKLDYAEEFI